MARNAAYLARKKARSEAKRAEREAVEREQWTCKTCGDYKHPSVGDWCVCDLKQVKKDA